MADLNYIYSYDSIVIGTGAAGYNAACRLAQSGNRTVAIVTEGINCGTSRNTGSDKQTYYKLGLSGDSPDSVRSMASNLFAGGSVDGDNALCEAALSARCFLNLCELGVPFPVNRYGEYVGYKTDHDPYARATSAGPLTSKFMTEALQKKALELKIKVFDRLLAIEILNNEDGVCGLLCLNLNNGEYTAICCADIIIATGGPAGIYEDSVFPECHTGSTGLALDAGVSLQNMTEWQYGLASINPRWNVSGTYMQVIPRFVSVDEEDNEYEFLSDYFSDIYEAMSAVFLKGYQWPFDSRKVMTGSSVIDLLVYRECVMKKRRVFLDYTKNPFGLDEIDFTKLSIEAYDYIRKAESCFGKPIERLAKMNQPAIDLYASKGLDITKDYLEIALCAQHNNGGIAVDLWWQTEMKGLFAAGECAGTHGVTRPGGSALNAGQVGSLRAAQYISAKERKVIKQEEFFSIAEKAYNKHIKFRENILKNGIDADKLLKKARRRMSDCGAAIRDKKAILTAINEIRTELADFENMVSVGSEAELYKAYKLKDAITVQYATLCAMKDFSEVTGITRGSSLYTDENGSLRDGLNELFRFTEDNGLTTNKVQQVKIENGECVVSWRDVRPLPSDDDFFENIWRVYRENKNIY